MRHEEVKSFKREPALAPLALPPGNLFRRSLTARAIGHVAKLDPVFIAEQLWPSDRAVGIVLRATSAPAMTTVAGWAQELAVKYVADTIEALGAASAAADVLERCLVLNWDGAGSLTVPNLVAAAANGGFVQEGSPIPVRQLSSTGPTINPFKVASIAVLSREMIESSNAEAYIGDTLIKSAALAIDAAFFDNAAATAARPAGIRNGISTITASNNADFFAAVGEDVAALVNAVAAVGNKGPFILVANAGRAAGFDMRFSRGNTIIVLTSSLVGTDLIAIAPQAIAAAFSPTPDIETATTGTLMMDTAPQVVGTTGQSERSLFQTDSIALKIRWPVSWVVRDSRGVAWTTPSWK